MNGCLIVWKSELCTICGTMHKMHTHIEIETDTHSISWSVRYREDFNYRKLFRGNKMFQKKHSQKRFRNNIFVNSSFGNYQSSLLWLRRHSDFSLFFTKKTNFYSRLFLYYIKKKPKIVVASFQLSALLHCNIHCIAINSLDLK